MAQLKKNRSQLQNWGYLATKLIEKHNEELDVKVALYDDDINRKHGVDLAEVSTQRIKSSKGGIMHNKFL